MYPRGRRHAALRPGGERIPTGRPGRVPRRTQERRLSAVQGLLVDCQRFQWLPCVFRPVPSGQCRKIGDLATHAWSSAVNNALVPVRLWQVAENTKDGARCGVERFRHNGIVRPFRAARQFSFHTAEGLGGL